MSELIKLPISPAEVFGIEIAESPKFPKYASSLMNLAGSTSHATRPPTVGKMTELVQEFKEQHTEVNLQKWREWYMKKNPQAIEQATKKICTQLTKYRDVLKEIDENTVRSWVIDLVINKSFQGLIYQEICIKKTANYLKQPWRLANSSEESEGIDGFISTTPVQVKKEPGRYHVLMDQLPPKFALILYKAKTDGSLFVEFASDITGIREV